MALRKLLKYFKSLPVNKVNKAKVTEVPEEKNQEALKNMKEILEKQLPEESQTIRDLEKLKKLVFATPACDPWAPDMRNTILNAIYLLEESENKQKALLDEAVESLKSCKRIYDKIENNDRIGACAVAACINIVNNIKFEKFGVDKKEMIKAIDFAMSINFVKPKNYEEVLKQIKHLVEREKL